MVRCREGDGDILLCINLHSGSEILPVCIAIFMKNMIQIKLEPLGFNTEEDS